MSPRFLVPLCLVLAAASGCDLGQDDPEPSDTPDETGADPTTSAPSSESGDERGTTGAMDSSDGGVLDDTGTGDGEATDTGAGSDSGGGTWGTGASTGWVGTGTTGDAMTCWYDDAPGGPTAEGCFEFCFQEEACTGRVSKDCIAACEDFLLFESRECAAALAALNLCVACVPCEEFDPFPESLACVDEEDAVAEACAS